MIERIEPMIDLSTEEAFVNESNILEEEEIEKDIQLIRKLNRHSYVVLKTPFETVDNNKEISSSDSNTFKVPFSSSSSSSRKANSSKTEQTIENLKKKHVENHFFSDLLGDEKVEVSEVFQANSISNLEMDFQIRNEPNSSFSSSFNPLEDFKVGQSHSLDENLSMMVLEEISPDSKLLKNNAQAPMKENIKEINLLFQVSSKTNELLRHFWSCFPIKSNEVANKAKRIYEAIDVHYDQVQKVGNLFKSENGCEVYKLLKPLDTAIDFYCNYKSNNPLIF